MKHPTEDAENHLQQVGRVLRDFRERLEVGGPAVDYSLIVAYVDNQLAERERKAVAYWVARYKGWYDAYWEVSTDYAPD